MPQVRARLWAELRDGVRDPLAWSEVIQLVKTVLAAVLAWVLAAEVFDLPQSFLAPWSALLVVHATVYRTFSRGLRQVGGAVLGVVLAWGIGGILGLSTLAVALLLIAGLVIGSLRWFLNESTTVAATGLIVLTTGFSTDDQMLLTRLYDTGIGIVVGFAVNAIVWPPLRDYSAVRAIDVVDDGVGRLLCDMASELGGPCSDEHVSDWVDRTRDLDGEIDHAWSLLRQAKESSRLNPRRAARDLAKTEVYESVLRRNEQAVAETRSMARTLGHSIESMTAWEPRFRDTWVALLAEAGAAISAPDSVRVAQVRRDLSRLAEDLSASHLSSLHWPEYGALITNLRNVVTAMDRVAELNPVVLPRYAKRDGLFRGR